LFFGSYFPLALILLAQDYDYRSIAKPLCVEIWDSASNCYLPLQNPWLSLSVFTICGLCLALSVFALTLAEGKQPIDIRSVDYIPAELMSYTLPYVVSFMALDYQGTGKLVGLVIFLFWMFWITHRSGQIILNPLLVAFGWRLYRINYTFPGDSVARTGQALSKVAFEPDCRVSHTFMQDVMILTKIKKGGVQDGSK